MMNCLSKDVLCQRRNLQVWLKVVDILKRFESQSTYGYAPTTATTTKMLAWQIHQYGNVDEVTLSTSAKAATIKSPNELLIKVHASSVNPIDVRMMGGYGRALINVLRKQKGTMKSGTEFPLTLGRDFSGTVVEAGRGVTKFKAGDEVWGALGAEKPGTHAKFTVVAESEISRKPSNISHLEAASIPYVATTTWAGLCTVGELKERKAAGKRLLILGGSGGIGTFAIQLGKAWGMHVTTTCSGDAVQLVRDLGADAAIDYRKTNVWNELKRVEKFDYILDTLGNENTNRALPFLSPWQNAQLITLVSPLLRNSDSMGVVPGLLRTAVSAGVDTLKGIQSGGSVRWAVFIPNGAALDRVRHMVESDQIRPVVQEVFPFNDVPGAFKRVHDGHLRGKIVIDNLSG